MNFRKIFQAPSPTDDASKTIGNATIVSKSVSRSHGIGANVNLFSKNVNSSVVSPP